MTECPDAPRRTRRRRWLQRGGVLLVLSTVIVLATSTSVAGYPASPRYIDGRFRNQDPPRERSPDAPEVGRLDFFFGKPAGTVPATPIPMRAITRTELDVAPDRSLYRLGHSTLLLRLRGQWWLTDPVFSERASPVQWAGPKRFHAPPIALADLPPIRGVLLSHDHYDHLDRASVRTLATAGARFYAPLGVGDRLTDWGIAPAQVRQFDWWQGVDVDGLRLTATPAQHFSGRSLADRDRTLWTSWVIQDGDFRLFFSGDTGYFSGFREIGERFGPFDVTFLETGAYNASWPGVHMQPEETVQAHRHLRGRWLLPMHNGTFDLAMHAWQEPFERVKTITRAHGVQVTTPAFGERLQLDAPHAGGPWWREAAPAAQALAPAAATR